MQDRKVAKNEQQTSCWFAERKVAWRKKWQRHGKYGQEELRVVFVRKVTGAKQKQKQKQKQKHWTTLRPGNAMVFHRAVVFAR